MSESAPITDKGMAALNELIAHRFGVLFPNALGPNVPQSVVVTPKDFVEEYRSVMEQRGWGREGQAPTIEEALVKLLSERLQEHGHAYVRDTFILWIQRYGSENPAFRRFSQNGLQTALAHSRTDG